LPYHLARCGALNTLRPTGGPLIVGSHKVVEVVGTSNESISKAIGRAISKAGTTLRHLGWFEVVQIRGSIENNQVGQYQVTIKVGFTLEED
jgi:dodecin